MERKHKVKTMDGSIKGVLFDIDGVLEFQGKVYDGAVDLVNQLRGIGMEIRIISNSTLKSRASCANKLKARGFEVDEQEVVTASYATAQYLKLLHPRSCHIMLNGEGLAEFMDFVHDDEQPEYVVLGDCREEFNFLNMNKALQLLIQGSKLIVMIPERIDNSMGSLELTVGAYGKMLEDAAGITAIYIGKPNRFIFDTAISSMPDVRREEILMIGDKVSTDILGARNAEIRSVLVKTGEFQEKDLDFLPHPDYILNSIRDVATLFPMLR